MPSGRTRQFDVAEALDRAPEVVLHGAHRCTGAVRRMDCQRHSCKNLDASDVSHLPATWTSIPSRSGK